MKLTDELTTVMSNVLELIIKINGVLISHEHTLLKLVDLVDKQNDSIELLTFKLNKLSKPNK